MKNILRRFLYFIMLTGFYFTATAQHTDSIRKIKRTKDSIFRLANPGHYVPDTVSSNITYLPPKKKTVFSKQEDSLRLLRKKISDSIYKKVHGTVKFSDSLKRKVAYQLFKSDSLHSKLSLHLKRQDSLNYRKYLSHASNSDSLRQLYVLNVKLDSLHKYKVYRTVKLDSLKRKQYQQNVKSDSLRIKNYLQFKKVQLQKFYEDTTAVKNGYRTRELSMEISCFEGDTVYINNNYKKVIIKVIPSQKLRLSTIINYKEPLNERGHEILKKMGIKLSRNSSSVTATINGSRPPFLRDANDPCTDIITMESNVRRALYIELPGNAFIVLNTKYADTNIETFVTSINARVTNGTLKMESADMAIIKSAYSTIKADEIKKADLDLSNTKFKARNIVTMRVVSSSSNMQLSNCTAMNLVSVSDEYRVGKAGSISGSKDFGNLDIENLKEKLVLTGTNADIKVDNLGYEAPFIKIDNKYADLKLPLYDQKNYAVQYEGSYNDVNKLSSATQKINGIGNITAKLSVLKDTLASMGKTSGVNKTKFEANAGDITGSHTKIDIVCPYCSVVFN